MKEKKYSYQDTLCIFNNEIMTLYGVKILCIKNIINESLKINNGWFPNWKDKKEKKYFFKMENNKIKIGLTYINNISFAYFKSINDIKKAYNELGEETIKYSLINNY